MTFALSVTFLLGACFGAAGTVAVWFGHDRKKSVLDDMDQAEDYVNTLDRGTFLRIRSACMLRSKREERRQASGAA